MMHSGYLREGAEKARAFVLLMGNLGNHHTGLDARALRGFAFADPIAPFVVINKNNSRAAWSVMLLHELAHLWLGQTSVSGYDGEGGPSNSAMPWPRDLCSIRINFRI